MVKDKNTCYDGIVTLLNISLDRYLDGIHNAVVFNKGGGAKVYAQGILMVINKGLQKKIEFK